MLLEMWSTQYADVYIFFCGILYTHYIHCWELMKSVASHGSLSLLLKMSVMVWHFVSDTHKVMTNITLVELH